MRDVQRQLFQWRMDFFKAHFFSMFCGHDLPASNWITLGLDDSHIFDTLPYNVTQNFEEVMMLASTKKILDPNQDELFFFSNNECASGLARRKFEWEKDDCGVEYCGCSSTRCPWCRLCTSGRGALRENDDIENVSGKCFLKAIFGIPFIGLTLNLLAPSGVYHGLLHT